ncbi:MAG: hypothetical protein C4533_00895 [Candidatus Omnitrophota bacterium]|jgi:rubrerythrin|nr:MAG: hypothetical protein C4533_00895 [Candidatus Omnitrophota bacterium]
MHLQERNGKLIITDFSEPEAYKIALKIEQDGKDFYKKLLEKGFSEDIDSSLNFLVGEEAKHLKIFEEALFSFRQGHEDNSDENDLLTSVDYGIFQPYASIKELNQIITEPKKAFELGLLIENNSIRFYNAVKAHIGSPGTKDTLALIIKEEERHKELLEKMINKM